MAFWNLPEGEPGRRRIEKKGESDGLGQKYDGQENIKGERKRIEPRSPPPPLAASRRDNQKKRLRPLSDIVRRVLRLKVWPDETILSMVWYGMVWYGQMRPTSMAREKLSGGQFQRGEAN